MDFGLILPSYRAGASAEGIEAAAASIPSALAPAR